MIHVEVIYASMMKEVVKIGPLWSDFEITMFRKIKNKNLVAINCSIDKPDERWPRLLADLQETHKTTPAIADTHASNKSDLSPRSHSRLEHAATSNKASGNAIRSSNSIVTKPVE